MLGLNTQKISNQYQSLCRYLASTGKRLRSIGALTRYAFTVITSHYLEVIDSILTSAHSMFDDSTELFNTCSFLITHAVSCILLIIPGNSYVYHTLGLIALSMEWNHHSKTKNNTMSASFALIYHATILATCFLAAYTSITATHMFLGCLISASIFIYHTSNLNEKLLSVSNIFDFDSRISQGAHSIIPPRIQLICHQSIRLSKSAFEGIMEAVKLDKTSTILWMVARTVPTKVICITAIKLSQLHHEKTIKQTSPLANETNTPPISVK